MFGYVMANMEALTEAEKTRFRACYCGLCRELRTRYGLTGQLTLSFDLTFLQMVLSSLYEPEETSGSERCAARPGKKHPYVVNAATEYAAGMNVALAYHKCMDDWADERKLFKRTEAGLLKKSYRRVEAAHAQKCRAIEAGIRALSEIEKRRLPDVDAPANCFGELLGELFVWKDDHWADALRAMGANLGRFIYVMDAYDDLDEDEKKGAFNPLVALKGDLFENTVRDALTMLIGQCAHEFEKLPLLQDAEILRNVLYSGVWTKYLSVRARREKASGAADAPGRKGEKA